MNNNEEKRAKFLSLWPFSCQQTNSAFTTIVHQLLKPKKRKLEGERISDFYLLATSAIKQHWGDAAEQKRRNESFATAGRRNSTVLIKEDRDKKPLQKQNLRPAKLLALLYTLTRSSSGEKGRLLNPVYASIVTKDRGCSSTHLNFFSSKVKSIIKDKKTQSYRIEEFPAKKGRVD